MPDTSETLLRSAQVAKILQCSVPWVYKASESGLLPSVRIPCPGKGQKQTKTMVRFQMADVMEFIDAHRKGAVDCPSKVGTKT
jgi:predicted DNA-binding transcriptional regulator AlpA